MKNEYTFSLPDKLQQKIGQSYFPDLLKLATRAGNRDLFLDLETEDKDYEEVAAQVGAEREFEEYDQLIRCYRCEEANWTSSELTGEFYFFLLARICFPEEFSSRDSPPVAADVQSPVSES